MTLNNNLLSEAIRYVGRRNLAQSLGLSTQALWKWEKRGSLPMTEWSGTTHYARQISLLSEGKYSEKTLLHHSLLNMHARVNKNENK